uniref:Uncharacterized protein n=1 Tax=Arundo donax TaxID=35708 RepID=A0A0A9C5B8_ARUDO
MHSSLWLISSSYSTPYGLFVTRRLNPLAIISSLWISFLRRNWWMLLISVNFLSTTFWDKKRAMQIESHSDAKGQLTEVFGFSVFHHCLDNQKLPGFQKNRDHAWLAQGG